jgi:hypothetical protein
MTKVTKELSNYIIGLVLAIVIAIPTIVIAKNPKFQKTVG